MAERNTDHITATLPKGLLGLVDDAVKKLNARPLERPSRKWTRSEVVTLSLVWWMDINGLGKFEWT